METISLWIMPIITVVSLILTVHKFLKSKGSLEDLDLDACYAIGFFFLALVSYLNGAFMIGTDNQAHMDARYYPRLTAVGFVSLIFLLLKDAFLKNNKSITIPKGKE